MSKLAVASSLARKAGIWEYWKASPPFEDRHGEYVKRTCEQLPKRL